MRFWPGNKRETRADSLTATLIALIQERSSGGTTATSQATGALEACAGLVQRAFLVADVDAPPALKSALTSELLGMVGRSLIKYGEIVFFIDTTNGALALRPAETFDIQGPPNPDQWRYRLTLGGPSETLTYNDIPADSVVHVRYAVDPATPWRALSPLGVATLAGKLSAETTKALADESGMPRGGFLPIPLDGQDPTVTALKADIKRANGGLLTVESGDWDAQGGARKAEWMQTRFGPNPPVGLVSLMGAASGEVYAACGVNPSLFTDAQGTAQRESYRQFLFGLVAPLGKLVAAELSAKLEADVTLGFEEIRAADIAGRARAFQSMVGAGMEVAKAAALSGLLTPE